MNKVKQILQWHSEGVSKKQINLQAGVNRNTVKSEVDNMELFRTIPLTKIKLSPFSAIPHRKAENEKFI